MKKIVLMSLVASSILMAGGYQIPESSTNAVALGAANVAHNHNSADAAYYNPAKMIFMSDENHLDVNLMYIGLDGVTYKGSQTDKFGNTASGLDLKAKKENFVLPTIHYVSPKLGASNARVGLSIVSPAGLTKRWEEGPAKTSAEEFTLKTVEINPTAAFEINNKLAFAVGFRIVYSEGVVKSNGTIVANQAPSVTSVISRDMTGNSIDFGYNLALAYSPTSDLELALTYRSKIDLTEEGDAKLSSTTSGIIPSATYSGVSSVAVPLPATFSAAIAYTLPSKTTLEMVYERTYWSAYKSLDFGYDGTITNPVLVAAFNTPIAKKWKDTNTYRFGVTQELDKLTLMAGLVIDETPVPDSSLSYELPDSDSVAVSLGARYKINDKIDIGLAGLYSM
ncbi:MAG: outer membrane protein transport protein, partial [Sulfurimonas sp.]